MKKDPYQRREAEKYDQPIASREHILSTLEAFGVPASLKRLAKTLELENAERRSVLEARLRAMVRDGQLVVDRRNVRSVIGPDGVGLPLIRDHGIEVAVAVEVAEGD